MNFHVHILDELRDLYTYRDEPERFHVLADLYWRMLLWIVAVITCGALIYGVWQLFEILNPPAASPTLTKPTPDALNKSQLQSVLDGFAARRAAYENFKNNPPQVADPAR